MDCEPCPAGSKRTLGCGWANPSCHPCSPGTYNDRPNTHTDCIPCDKRCKVKHQVVVGGCTALQNIVCECKPGFYRRNSMERSCEKHKSCPPGSGVFTPGTPTTDNECKLCPPGSYSNLLSSTQGCLSHTPCGKLGVKHAGTNLTDNVCNSTPPSGGALPTWGIVLISSVGSLLIILLVVLMLVQAWRRRTACQQGVHMNNRRAHEVNDLNADSDTQTDVRCTEFLLGANIKGSTKTLNTYSSVSEDGEIDQEDKMDIPPSFQDGLRMDNEEVGDLNSFMHLISSTVPSSHPLVANLPGAVRAYVSPGGERPQADTLRCLKAWRDANPNIDHVGVLQRAVCQYRIQLHALQ